jgi:hydroxymethylglutaryl-CoA reductase
MKKIFWFVLLLLFSHKAMSQNIVSIKLTEATRGVHKEIFMSEKSYLISDNSQTKKKAVSPETWQKINVICKKIDIENLSKYQSSTRKRANDAALQATLEITTKSTTFQSDIFDHDNPPKEFLELIKELKKF